MDFTLFGLYTWQMASSIKIIKLVIILLKLHSFLIIKNLLFKIYTKNISKSCPNKPKRKVSLEIGYLE